MNVLSTTMRWEKVQHQQEPKVENGGPGMRWGHTCNAVGGGKRLYVFGGYGRDHGHTNQVHVYDTVGMFWNEPVMKGMPPCPRDSHSCTTLGAHLFVFGGTDGSRPLNDLYILDTSSNTWIFPTVRGDGPEPREGHSAAIIGRRLFIFGGCGKSGDEEIYYDDLYILNTETFVWKRVVPSGTPPTKRNSHTCSSWRNKIIVIGGEDAYDYYLSDVHVLDCDTLVWCKLNTTGQLLPPRGGHTTISFGKNLFVFGGFSDEQNLYDDVYMFDIENSTWAKIAAIGEGPSGRFSMAGDTLDPLMGGVLVFMGGCNKNLEPLDDMYYLYTGLSRENEHDERRGEKLSLRKQLKLKCREQLAGNPAYERNSFGVQREQDTTVYQPMPISSYMPSGRQTFYLNEYQKPLGKRTFQAKITKNLSNGYSIETIIDGKPLRGLLFSNKPSSIRMGAGDPIRKMEPVKNDGPNGLGAHNSSVETDKALQDQSDASRNKAEVPAAHAVSASATKDPAAELSKPQEQDPGQSEPMALDINMEIDASNHPSSSSAEIPNENASIVGGDQINPSN
ncbi:tip elongation aberrant protein 1-like [Andrographis paniculata]|uniref:tip elongation aberrant protein 1-like n=1 Tax=Andrographis paniculata TaxID=175694 RepID=UPI0021E997A7|nr:tip elongation aberrant protein 1-like [Andrographis paniculata]